MHFNYSSSFRYDHPNAIAAAGCIGIEILKELPDTDAIIIPVGGGGLLAGIAAYAKHMKPNLLIYVKLFFYSFTFHYVGTIFRRDEVDFASHQEI